MEEKPGISFTRADRAFVKASQAFNSVGTPLIVTGRKGSGRLPMAFCLAELWAVSNKKGKPRKRRISVNVVSSVSRKDILEEMAQAAEKRGEDWALVLQMTNSPDEWARAAKISQRADPDLFILDDIDSHEQADAAIDLIKNGYKVILVTTGSAGTVKGDSMPDMILRMLVGRFPATSVPVLDATRKSEA